MIKKIIYISVFAFLLQTSFVNAGTEGSEEIKGNKSQNTANECFEGFSRAMFSLNHGLDKAVFKPVAKGYRALPPSIRKGTGNVVDNLRSLLTVSNNVLQGDFSEAGITAGRFVIKKVVKKILVKQWVSGVHKVDVILFYQFLVQQRLGIVLG